MVGVFCFRNDLRLHDNLALQQALAVCDQLFLVYAFEDRIWKSKHNQIGFFRAQFLLESLYDIEKGISQVGGSMTYIFGNIEDSIPPFMDEVHADICFLSEENAWNEKEAENSLSQKVHLKTAYDKTLIHLADLPFSLDQLPDSFSKFRKSVETNWNIRSCISSDLTASKITKSRGNLPALRDFGITQKTSPKGYYSFTGSSTAGRKRLHEWFWEKGCISTYKKTRNQLKGADFSSHFSPWIANGSLSPREIYHETKKYEALHGANESTYWLIFELLWRDFFQFFSRLHGRKVFHPCGLNQQKEIDREPDQADLLFFRWVNGCTANLFINANINELNQTGWMSNRGRQNVASYLIHDLGLGWRRGAEWFEKTLIDYDPCSNYGNWLYLAGYCSEKKTVRYFNTTIQSMVYDPKGEYTKDWIDSPVSN
jgi:deoxyribodipyrimidine photo-lyase